MEVADLLLMVLTLFAKNSDSASERDYYCCFFFELYSKLMLDFESMSFFRCPSKQSFGAQ